MTPAGAGLALAATSGGQHVAHAVSGGVAVVLALSVLIVHRVRSRPEAGRDPAVPAVLPLSQAPAAASPAGWLIVAVLGAATVHAAASRGHFEESTVLGLFFLVLSLAQYGYAAALWLRPSTVLLRAGLVANAAVALLWADTRLVSIPLGLGGREPVGAADLIATGFELAAVAAAVIALRRPLPRGSLTSAQRVAAVFAVALTSAVVATTGAG